MCALEDPRVGLLPLLIKSAELHRLLCSPAHAQTFAHAWNWADAWTQIKAGAAAPARYQMLRQALAARRVLIILDGLDEVREASAPRPAPAPRTCARV